MTDDTSIDIFLKKRVPGWKNHQPIAGDASTREYFRVFSDAGTYILCRDDAFIGTDPREYPFIIVHGLLQGRVPVPDIVATDQKQGFILLQDLGDELLEDRIPQLDRASAIALYQQVVDNLLAIQVIEKRNGVPFSICFDVERLLFELNFFIEHGLKGYFNADLSIIELTDLKECFKEIALLLYRPELFVLNHRDYHSRNIMMHNNSPYIIDFQDARMGLPHYDAVSLLRDSYIQLQEDIFSDLKEYYCRKGRELGIHEMDDNEFEYFFDIQGFQRNLKAIGTFAYQSRVKGNRLYEKYIPPTVHYLHTYTSRCKRVQEAWKILKRHLIGGTERK